MRSTSKISAAFVLAIALPGCNGSDSGATASGGSSEESGTPSTATAPTSEGVSADGTGTTVDTTPADSSGAPESSEDDDGPGIYYDLGIIPDTPTNGNDCDDKKGGKGGGGGGVGPDFSFIWVANSQEGTVSKIDTQSLEEVGRYRTRDDANGSPSRTSVNLNGDVAVANRSGGVVKIISHVPSCPDPGNTSSGAGDVKPFPDGCVDWFTPMAYQSNRPVAWTSGTFSGLTCRYENTKVWTSGGNGPGQIDVMFLDGETGDVEQTVPIPEAQWDGFGIYGGATDADGNFWGSQLSIGHLVFVDVDSFDHEAYPMPLNGYGMTVDEQGRAFTCSTGIARFDHDTATWETNPNVGGGGGCMTDGEGTLWIGGNSGGGGSMIGVDTETLDVVQTIPIPNYVHGISVDFYGYVWGVTLQQTWAYRVDPVAATFDTFTGLTGPYTYSDMTGYALSNASGLPPTG